MAFRVAIIGGGWYGSHIGLALRSLQMDVTIYERSHRLFDSASGNNQFRLHQGFHYARHHATRMQSRDGFIRFIERYPSLSAPVADNMYAVPSRSSLIDFDTYKLIMVSSGLRFVEIDQGMDFLANIEGVIKTEERVILLDRARRYFTKRLGRALNLETSIETIDNTDTDVLINGERYDYAVDATWGHLSYPGIAVNYEPTILLYYETKESFPAVTLVDGPLASVYPTEDRTIYTLSSVLHTPLGCFGTAAEAVACRSVVGREVVAAKRRAMETQIRENIPQFLEYFRFMGVQLAVKTKPIGKFDDRSCHVSRNGRTFVVMSGKIDTVFFATERILAMIEAEHADVPTIEDTRIKHDILMTDDIEEADGVDLSE